MNTGGTSCNILDTAVQVVVTVKPTGPQGAQETVDRNCQPTSKMTSWATDVRSAYLENSSYRVTCQFRVCHQVQTEQGTHEPGCGTHEPANFCARGFVRCFQCSTQNTQHTSNEERANTINTKVQIVDPAVTLRSVCCSVLHSHPQPENKQKNK